MIRDRTVVGLAATRDCDRVGRPNLLTDRNEKSPAQEIHTERPQTPRIESPARPRPQVVYRCEENRRWCTDVKKNEVRTTAETWFWPTFRDGSTFAPRVVPSPPVIDSECVSN